MKITNKTNYDTRYLRRLFLACEKHEGTNPKFRHIKIVYSRNGTIGGNAWYNSVSVVMKLPQPKIETLKNCLHIDKDGTQSTRDTIYKCWAGAHRTAQVYIHEVGHNLGLHHADMIRSSEMEITWWPDGDIPFKQITAKPKPNIIEVRATKAQKSLTKWQSRFNRAKSYVRKYQRQVKYYEKKMAASSVRSAE